MFKKTIHCHSEGRWDDGKTLTRCKMIKTSYAK